MTILNAARCPGDVSPDQRQDKHTPTSVGGAARLSRLPQGGVIEVWTKYPIAVLSASGWHPVCTPHATIWA